jgi:predicted nuclease of predicted toxin-antitoxin system
MKIKLDENLGRRCVALLREAGHDVATVFQQQLAGADDNRVIQVCAAEQRCLLTLDLDFSNPLRFSPGDYAGIAVIRLPAKPSHEDLINAVETFIAALFSNAIDGRLWIVEKGRIRIYRPDKDDD